MKNQTRNRSASRRRPVKRKVNTRNRSRSRRPAKPRKSCKPGSVRNRSTGRCRKINRSKRGPIVIPIKNKGKLTNLGYSTKFNAGERHKALKKAVKLYGPTDVIRKLNAVSILTRNKSPQSSKIFKQDMRWVQKTFGTTKNPKKPGRSPRVRRK